MRAGQGGKLAPLADTLSAALCSAVTPARQTRHEGHRGALYCPANTPIKYRNESAAEAMSEERTGNERGLVLEEATPRLKRPPLYQVILLNDDYTPMEFVVDVLQQVFGLDRQNATRVMLEVHTKGKGVCGVFTYEIAETKVAQVMIYARQHQHPLLCTMEEA
jgi:ATP-dependent Clp protease adaptor protein ClpS